MNSQIFNEIMREYEGRAKAAKILRDYRQNEIYDKIPRISEIDKELSLTGINIMKAILSKNNSLEDLQRYNESLLAERAELMENSPFPKDYLADIYKCRICQDTGYINNEKCSCLKQKLIEKYYIMSNLKSSLDKENFDTFKIEYYSDKKASGEGISPRNMMRAIYNFCLDFVNQFGNNFSNLLFYGDVGLGKTFLCNCIAKEILLKGHTVLYNTAGHLFKTIEDARFNREDIEDPGEKLNLFYTVDLLIIDDLGTEFDTMATRTALFNIINSRILDQKPVIISTNLPLSELKEKYTERIISRLEGNYRFCKFFGDDIRVIKKLSGE